MATSTEFINYVYEQVCDTGLVRYRKMFGEYMVYINDKPILLVCDDTVYIKIREEISSLMTTASKGYPYRGAKEHYILDIDDKFLTTNVINILEPITPIPKKRSNKKIKS